MHGPTSLVEIHGLFPISGNGCYLTPFARGLVKMDATISGTVVSRSPIGKGHGRPGSGLSALRDLSDPFEGSLPDPSPRNHKFLVRLCCGRHGLLSLLRCFALNHDGLGPGSCV